ncbi:MAG: TIGR03435 family protein [Candidatus Solibacter usitatus]|nr:TIGR03435 family protein [Candidatus Solibacter usitatus]
MAGLTNHLWQSTVFALFVALAALALKKHRAKTRYGLWLSASLKFLLPFSLLVGFGARMELPPVAPGMPALAVEQITMSFAPAPASGTSLIRWPMVFGAIWLAGAAILTVRWFRRWLLIRAALRGARTLPYNVAIPVLSTKSNIEPGVFGIFRPVLLLPDGISAQLSREEKDAIIAHELSHVRRRDNLTAAMHMLVEALFWFHPLVWWIGRKLVEERERACDEAVLDKGTQPHIYAQSILSVCKFYLQSPLPCTSGVSGGGLKKRIEEIMTGKTPLTLALAGRLTLALAACAAIAIPFAIGILRAQTLPPPPQYKFEVASIRPGDPSAPNARIGPGPQGGLRTENTPVMELLIFAYDLREYQFTGGPGWVRTDRFNITATPDKPEEALHPSMGREKFEGQVNRQRQRLQALLTERFGLVLRAETREMPVYALKAGKSGHKLVKTDETQVTNMSLNRNGGRLKATACDLMMLTRALSTILGRTVMDETELTGVYDLQLEWTPDQSPEGGGASVFTAVQEQLGLRLESKKGPVRVFVIEKIDKPSVN